MGCSSTVCVNDGSSQPVSLGAHRQCRMRRWMWPYLGIPPASGKCEAGMSCFALASQCHAGVGTLLQQVCCLLCPGDVMLQATGLAWAVPSTSWAVEELGLALMKLCRVPEWTCPPSKATQHPAVVAFICSPSSSCVALPADWGEWGHQWGKWSIRLVLGSFLSPGTPY